jgi:NAD(P)-dependent dehydrogenase (short-subunit alcohol dehydrogenase family)
MGRVQGKVTAITGAGAGIGRECMKLFAQEGSKVFGIGRTASKLDSVVTEVKKAGGTAASATADLSSPEQTERAFKALIDTFGRCDILVNCAGVGYALGQSVPGTMNDLATTSIEHWRMVMSINLDSVFYMARLAVPQMRQQGGGSIVNIASIYGMAGAADAHTYTASKGAIINLTRSMAVAYAKDNIRSNCVCPGFVDTDMVAAVMHWFKDPALAEMISPMRRAATPKEIAYAVLYMGSDEASYCNGAMLVADGGSTAR